MAVRAITFDFWRTLFREARSESRREARAVELARHGALSIDEAREVMAEVSRIFLRTHIEERRTLVPRDAIAFIEEHLGRPLEPGVSETLAQSFATAILDHPPEPLEKALDAVRAAAERYPVGIISDTGISPASSLERILERHGFRPHFKVLAFSDVVGVAKPQAAMYHFAADGLGVGAEELLHIGDLEPTDVAGAIAVGARAALFGGDNDRYVGATQAHYTYTSWAEFIERLPELAE